MAEENAPYAPEDPMLRSNLYPSILSQHSTIPQPPAGYVSPIVGFSPHVLPPQPQSNTSEAYAYNPNMQPPQFGACWFPTCPPPPPPIQVAHPISKPFNYYIAYRWVSTTSYHSIPPYAVQGGVDQDGTNIYVGRAHHEGDWIPAKVIPEKRVAYIAYNGEEIAKHDYEVLCEQRFEWIRNVGGIVPSGAVAGGSTSDGETLYIGRVEHEGSKTVGKVHPSHGSCYIPFNGEEVPYTEYEILVLKQ